jgi:hypothetical protein
MKKTLTLTESELVKVVNRIVEAYSDDTYDDEDYVEVFLHYFRPWIRANHGDEIGEYPLSYLSKKYMAEFAKDNGLAPENVIYGYKGNLGNASNIGKNLVKQGKHKMPSLRSQEKFIEKFKKPLEFFVNELNLPEFMELSFTENTPYKLYVTLKVDWERLIKYQGEKKFKPEDIKVQLQQRIKDFLGIELGNPTHGQLNFNFDKMYIDVDDWVKKSLNKEIKKKIRELPSARVLHAIKFETLSNSLGGELKFSFKNWNGRNDFMKDVKELLQRMGYNTDILKPYS